MDRRRGVGASWAWRGRASAEARASPNPVAGPASHVGRVPELRSSRVRPVERGDARGSVAARIGSPARRALLPSVLPSVLQRAVPRGGRPRLTGTGCRARRNLPGRRGEGHVARSHLLTCADRAGLCYRFCYRSRGRLHEPRDGHHGPQADGVAFRTRPRGTRVSASVRWRVLRSRQTFGSPTAELIRKSDGGPFNPAGRLGAAR